MVCPEDVSAVTAMVAVHRLVYHSKYSAQMSPVLHKTLNCCVHWLYSLALEKFTMKIVKKLFTVHKYKCTIHRKTLGHNSRSGSISALTPHALLGQSTFDCQHLYSYIGYNNSYKTHQNRSSQKQRKQEIMREYK